MSNAGQPHVAVIGGGVIGLTTAYRLVRDGATVTLIDARRTGQGASSINAGWVCPAESTPVPAPGMVSQAVRWMLRSDSPLYIRPSLDPSFVAFMLRMWRYCNATDFRAGLDTLLRLSEGTMELLDGYVADGVDFEMHQDGLLMAFRSDSKFDARVGLLAPAEAAGLEPQVLRGDAVRGYEPMLSDAVAGGVYFPHERHLEPASLTRALARRCRELGVTILEDTSVETIETVGDRVSCVRSGERVVHADTFVLAAGTWSGKLAKLLGRSLPIRPGKGYSVDVPPMELRAPVYLAEARVAVTPLDAALRLSGTMEFAGFDEEVDAVRVGAIAKAPSGFLRDWSTPERQVTAAGMRPMTPDGLPILGRLGRWQNVYVSTGHAMLGVTLAPVSAQLLSRLILRGESAPILEALRSDRFDGLRRRPAPPSAPA